MGNKGLITACDIHEHRLALIDKTMERLGIDIVNTSLSDATNHVADMDECFDYVLADVPCSGLGVMASKPELKFKSKSSEFGELIEIQKRILRNAISYTKAGGIIEYSTCTLNRKENEEVIETVMKESDEGLLRVLEMKTLMPYNCKVGFFYCIVEKNLPNDR